MRWATVMHSSFDRHWLVEYHKARKGRTLDMFDTTLVGRQLFFTGERAYASAKLWEEKGRNLKTIKTVAKPSV